MTKILSLESHADLVKQNLCLSCMECCKVIRIFTAHPFTDEAVKEFFAARGFELSNYKGYLAVTFPHVCEQLSLSGCRIYEQRPLVCAEYDGRNDPLMRKKCKWNAIAETSKFDLSEDK